MCLLIYCIHLCHSLVYQCMLYDTFIFLTCFYLQISINTSKPHHTYFRSQPDRLLITWYPLCFFSSSSSSPGQSSVCGKIMELLGQNKIDHHQRQVAILSQDSFYRVLTPDQKAKALKGQFNFDHPGIYVIYLFIWIPCQSLNRSRMVYVNN